MIDPVLRLFDLPRRQRQRLGPRHRGRFRRQRLCHGIYDVDQLSHPATAFQSSQCRGSYDAFVAKLNPAASGAASLIYSTYLGGSGSDAGNGIAVDSSGNAYVTGVTDSTNFPDR